LQLFTVIFNCLHHWLLQLHDSNCSASSFVLVVYEPDWKAKMTMLIHVSQLNINEF